MPSRLAYQGRPVSRKRRAGRGFLLILCCRGDVLVAGRSLPANPSGMRKSARGAFAAGNPVLGTVEPQRYGTRAKIAAPPSFVVAPYRAPVARKAISYPS